MTATSTIYCSSHHIIWYPWVEFISLFVALNFRYRGKITPDNSCHLNSSLIINVFLKTWIWVLRCDWIKEINWKFERWFFSQKIQNNYYWFLFGLYRPGGRFWIFFPLTHNYILLFKKIKIQNIKASNLIQKISLK
jgi:hypothetical protein